MIKCRANIEMSPLLDDSTI